ncbi:glycoside hydrolase superfamily, partial [Phascolomyces articulosus]
NLLFIRGQNAASESGDRSKWQKPLSQYCQDDTENILVISFLYQFGAQEPAMDLSDASADCNGYFEGTKLLDCPQMETEIEFCQSKDKVILLSLGGADGSYGISSESEGRKLADTLWNTFGGGESQTRPFGKAKIDGFDLDIEAGDTEGYAAFVDQMRQHYSSDTSKAYYMSAAPQCPYPDAYLSETLSKAWFDFVWVQFYNNYCGVTTDDFNYDTWDKWARTESPNKQVKLFIGVPASSYAAGSGFVSYEDLTKAITETRDKYESFGGVMMWDASAAYANTQDASPNYAAAVAGFLHNNSNQKGTNTITYKNTNNIDISDNSSNNTNSSSSTIMDSSSSASPSSSTPLPVSPSSSAEPASTTNSSSITPSVSQTSAPAAPTNG